MLTTETPMLIKIADYGIAGLLMSPLAKDGNRWQPMATKACLSMHVEAYTGIDTGIDTGNLERMTPTSCPHAYTYTAVCMGADTQRHTETHGETHGETDEDRKRGKGKKGGKKKRNHSTVSRQTQRQTHRQTQRQTQTQRQRQTDAHA